MAESTINQFVFTKDQIVKMLYHFATDFGVDTDEDKVRRWYYENYVQYMPCNPNRRNNERY